MYRVDITLLRVAMAEAGIITVEDLSKKSGVNRNTLSGVLNGTIYPSSAVMSKVAEALNLQGEAAGRIFFAPKLA